MEWDHKYKLVLLGDTAVGKSNLLMRFTQNKFNPLKSTIGLEFATKHVTIKDEHDNPVIIKAQVWDTAGAERYRALSNSYYRDAQGALLVFDITEDKHTTFENIKRWLQDLRQNSGTDTTVIIVGNKIDLHSPADSDGVDVGEYSQRKVPTEDAQTLADSLRCRYAETSALDGRGVNETFLALIQDVFALNSDNLSSDEESRRTLDSQTTDKDRCC